MRFFYFIYEINKKIMINFKNIKDIAEVQKDIHQYQCYFIDANAWIGYLEKQHLGKSPKYEKYIAFIDEIVRLNQKQNPQKTPPKIAITSLLLSEIINRYMRDIAMKLFFGDNYKEKNFKKDYRNTTNYKQKLADFIETITGFESAYILLNDDFNNIDLLAKLEDLKQNGGDFNDFYFYEIIKKNNIPIVTNDADFKDYPDIDIITNNATLLENKARFSPKSKTK